jgi:hypothetical protein
VPLPAQSKVFLNTAILIISLIIVNYNLFLSRAELSIHEEVINKQTEQLKTILNEQDSGLLIIEVVKKELNEQNLVNEDLEATQH